MFQHRFKTVIGPITVSLVALVCSSTTIGGEPGQSPTPSTATVKLPDDLAQITSEVTDTVLEHHIDPPTRQQMVLGGIKALYRLTNQPLPVGLSRRVSSVATPEQLTLLLAELWPKSTPKSITANQLEETWINGLLSGVAGEPRFSTAKERKVMEQAEGNRYVGIHIALGVDDQAKRPKMHEVVEGGPADKAGVKKDDVIEQIEGVDTKGMALVEAVDRLRGPEGTYVTIAVRQPNASDARTYTIRRGKHPRQTVQGIRKQSSGEWQLRLDGPDPIGYLRIAEMLGSTPHELRKMVTSLEHEGDRALVLDLRGLRGDAIHTAVLLADSLLDRGIIGRIKNERGETKYQADSDAVLRGWPIAVLVDADTSGAGEWLAAALQDNHRAVIVGSPTSGASINRPTAFVHSTFPIGDGKIVLTLATGSLERGDGRPLSLIDRPQIRSREEASRLGVHPDHMIAETPNHHMPPGGFRRLQNPLNNAAGARHDQALQKAVELLRASMKKV